MTDRELLERAAEAAGHVSTGKWDSYRLRCQKADGTRYWFAPLTDDGDALRLAVNIEETAVDVYDRNMKMSRAWASEFPDANVATRRAIVRAAAALAETRKPE